MSSAKMQSEMENDMGRRRTDGSHEDEKNLRADSPAFFDYILRCSKRN
jgi:hypothetical protein